MHFPIDRTLTPRLDMMAVQRGTLSNVPSDHMAVAEYANGQWLKARIQPYRPIPISPYSIVLHYAQTVFEGMKAYRGADGVIRIFRWEKHHARLLKSLARMCMPDVPADLFRGGVFGLAGVDSDWVPPGPPAAYYLRPFVFGSEEHVGLKPADEYMFMVLGAPFRAAYKGKLKIKVERDYSRAAPGGTGFAKCGGNYAGVMLPTKIAHSEGYDQVLWTDALTHSTVEEIGTTNVAFVIKGALVTPPLGNTILDGVTRDSVLTLARDMGVEVHERSIEVAEIVSGLKDGSVTEGLGFGTAASVVPMGMIAVDGVQYEFPDSPDGIATAVRAKLDGIRYGTLADTYKWMTVVEPE